MVGTSARWLRAADHRLPDLLVLGAKKSGSTSLFVDLEQHELLRGSRVKEPNFFNRNWRRGERYYRTFFPRDDEVDPAAKTFEGTPYYLVHRAVPERVASVLPGARFVVVLRDPVERAWSDHQAHVRRGREVRSFESVVASELAALTGDPDALAGDGSERSIVTQGLYHRALVRWFDHHPRESFVIADHRELLERPDEVLASVHAMLGLPSQTVAEPARRNVSGVGVDEADAGVARLRDFYRSHDEALFDLLGWDRRW